MTITSFKHELGLRAKDPISGFEGIIVSRVNYVFGCAHYGLASEKTEGGATIKTEYFDEARIEIIDNGVRPDGAQENEFDKIFMHQGGDEAKDKVTGFRGKIVYRIEYLHNCNQYGLAPSVDKDGKSREAEQFDEGRIEIIGVGVKPAEVQTEKRGGLNHRDAPSK